MTIHLQGIGISIHTPREGSDCRLIYYQEGLSYFNPHSPRGERPLSDIRRIFFALFQSTLPARGATVAIPFAVPFCANFNPHSPRGERPEMDSIHILGVRISIHTPREGSDLARLT